LVLEKILSKLTTAQSIYLHQLKSYLIPSKKRKSKKHLHVPSSEDDGNDDPRVQSFIRSLNSVISYSLPDPAWGSLVFAVFLELCGVSVGLSVKQDETSDTRDDDQDTVVDAGEASFNSEGSLSYQGAGLSQLSFNTVTDVDGDIIIDDDGNCLGDVEEMDGINEFEKFKKIGEERTRKRKEEKPREEARKKVLEIWGSMEKLGVGGGGRRGERVFAEVSRITLCIISRKLDG
jgi:anaphase-promoting complex subunit 2